MFLKKLKGIDILFYLVITYVMVAGGWWSYLLYIKNSDALTAKKEILWLQMKEQGISDRQLYLESAEYTRLTEQYERQKWMIFGESSVLLILIVLGIWRIAKSRQKELALAEQQRNFLLSITHELKSPIAVIKLTLDTFNKRTLTPEQSKMLTTNALADTDRLNKLVEDLLLAARVDGGYQYTFETLDLSLLLQKCIQIASPKYSGKIEFNNKLEGTTLKKGDQTTLSSVFLNIIENAVKYAPNTSRIIVTLMQSKENYCVEIADFGQGISKLERENIFEKFYRVGNEDTRKTKGTGLGLYIAERIVKAHKGSITIKSNQPTGTIFHVALPKS